MSELRLLDVTCSRCGKSPKECSCPPEEVKDIEGSENMEPEWGERFRGWYLTKTEKSCDLQSVGFQDYQYPLRICDYNYRFIMPSKLDFEDGLITYTAGERLLGVFRFPRDADGKYSSPISWNRKQVEGLLSMSEEQLKELLQKSEVLTFEAFRTSQFGFEFLDLSPVDFAKISMVTGSAFLSEFRQRYETELNRRIEEVKFKIRSAPNNLFILLSILNRRAPDMKEVLLMTDGIIHL